MKTLVYIQILLKLPVQHVQNDHVSELRGIAPSLDTKSVNDIKEYFLTEKAEFSHQNYRSLRTNHSFFSTCVCFEAQSGGHGSWRKQSPRHFNIQCRTKSSFNVNANVCANSELSFEILVVNSLLCCLIIFITVLPRSRVLCSSLAHCIQLSGWCLIHTQCKIKQINYLFYLTSCKTLGRRILKVCSLNYTTALMCNIMHWILDMTRPTDRASRRFCAITHHIIQMAGFI